jgi:hypothetical protein
LRIAYNEKQIAEEVFAMKKVMTKNGVELRVEDSIIYTTDSKAYWRSGNMLVGNGKAMSYTCRSMDEAVDIVAALYGGKE